MTPITLNLTHAQITGKSERIEKHDDEPRLAMDINFSVWVEDIRFFGLNDMDWTPITRVIMAHESHSHVVTIKDMYHDITLMDCRVCKFKFEPADKGFNLSFQVSQSEPADTHMVAISHLLQSFVEVTIAPEAIDREKMDALKGPFADALMDAIEGKDDVNG